MAKATAKQIGYVKTLLEQKIFTEEDARKVESDYHERSKWRYTIAVDLIYPENMSGFAASELIKALIDAPTREQKTLQEDGREMTIGTQETTPTTLSPLEQLITEKVSGMVSEEVLKTTIPALHEIVQKTYGVLPKQEITVKTPKQTTILHAVVNEKFETVLQLVSAKIPVFLTGPAGCGKNVLCQQIAESLGQEFFFSNAVTQEYKLTGFIDANGRYNETQFYKAFTSGGVFMLDEIDASTPEVLVILNAAIANRYFDFPTGKVTAHEDFRVVAAGNTFGTGADIEYTGRYQLDAASLDRFAIVEIDYSSAIEEALSGGNIELVAFIHSFRKEVQSANLKFIVSYRAIERLTKLESIFDLGEAIQLAVLRGLDKEDAKMLSGKIELPDNKYAKAFRKGVR